MDTNKVASSREPNHRGAEANLYLSRFGPWQAIVKRRIAKEYRQKELDHSIRKERTIKEATIMSEARKAGVRTPSILELDTEDHSFSMSHIPGQLARDSLDTIGPAERDGLFEDLGRQVGLLHERGIVHGDLTTSNLIISQEKRVYLIDFGLASYSTEPEDRAVDLHLLKRSIATSHRIPEARCFKAFSKGYASSLGNSVASKVQEKASEIARRGRYFAIR